MNKKIKLLLCSVLIFTLLSSFFVGFSASAASSDWVDVKITSSDWDGFAFYYTGNVISEINGKVVSGGYEYDISDTDTQQLVFTTGPELSFSVSAGDLVVVEPFSVGGWYGGADNYLYAYQLVFLDDENNIVLSGSIYGADKSGNSTYNLPFGETRINVDKNINVSRLGVRILCSQNQPGIISMNRQTLYVGYGNSDYNPNNLTVGGAIVNDYSVSVSVDGSEFTEVTPTNIRVTGAPYYDFDFDCDELYFDFSNSFSGKQFYRFKFTFYLSNEYAVSKNEMSYVDFPVYSDTLWNGNYAEQALSSAAGCSRLSSSGTVQDGSYTFGIVDYKNLGRTFNNWHFIYPRSEVGEQFTKYEFYLTVYNISRLDYFTFVLGAPKIIISSDSGGFPAYSSPNTSVSDNLNNLEQEILAGTQAGQDAASDILGGTSGTLANLVQSLNAMKVIYGDLFDKLPAFNDIISISLSLGFFAFLLGVSVDVFKGGSMAAAKAKEGVAKFNNRKRNHQVDSDMRKLGM